MSALRQNANTQVSTETVIFVRIIFLSPNAVNIQTKLGGHMRMVKSISQTMGVRCITIQGLEFDYWVPIFVGMTIHIKNIKYFLRLDLFRISDLGFRISLKYVH